MSTPASGYSRCVEFEEVVELVGKVIDAVGVAIIAAGLVYVTAVFAWRKTGVGDGDRYRRYRQAVGRVILLGLEFLVAADIIRTVAVSPTFRSAGVLALIVVIRTFLSFTLELELEGRWPWQRRPEHAG